MPVRYTRSIRCLTAGVLALIVTTTASAGDDSSARVVRYEHDALTVHLRDVPVSDILQELGRRGHVGAARDTRRAFVWAAHDRLEMALITPAARGDFAVTLATDVPKKGAGIGRRLVPFEVKVPVSSLTFLDAEGKKKAVVEIGLAAVEDTGARSVPVTEKQEIVVPAETLAAAQDAFVYRGEFKSRTGNMRFVATVRDVATNRIGVGSASVRVE